MQQNMMLPSALMVGPHLATINWLLVFLYAFYIILELSYQAVRLSVTGQKTHFTPRMKSCTADEWVSQCIPSPRDFQWYSNVLVVCLHHCKNFNYAYEIYLQTSSQVTFSPLMCLWRNWFKRMAPSLCFSNFWWGLAGLLMIR